MAEEAGWGSTISNFFKDYGKPLATAALVGTSIYQTNRAQKARERQAKAYQDAQNAEYEARKAAYGAGGGGGGGGGGGMSKKTAAKMSELYKEYYGKATGSLQPYIDSAQRVFPKQEELYLNKGIPGLSSLAQQMLSPEELAKLNRPMPSANSIKIDLPSYLKGGAK